MSATRLKGHNGPVYRCILTADGGYALSAGHDRTIKLWNPNKSTYDQLRDSKSSEGKGKEEQEGLLIQTYEEGHRYEVVDVSLSHDNTRFLSCGGDKHALVWDVKKGKVVRKLYGHEQRLNAVCLKPNDSTVAMTASNDATVRLWDMRQFNSRPIQVLSDFKDSVTGILCCEDQVVGSCMDGCVYVYDIRAGKLHVDDYGAGVSWITLSTDRKCILASCLSNPAEICLSEKSRGTLLKTYTGHQNKDYRLAACFDSNDETGTYSSSMKA
mmetsp:Transcript_13984/g.18309  ORF Transcript_13984/g.18309 Transcript_13984/m.18309 type:complete len:269 (+) Transcript_13984:263-1069(+)